MLYFLAQFWKFIPAIKKRFAKISSMNFYLIKCFFFSFYSLICNKSMDNFSYNVLVTFQCKVGYIATLSDTLFCFDWKQHEWRQHFITGLFIIKLCVYMNLWNSSHNKFVRYIWKFYSRSAQLQNTLWWFNIRAAIVWVQWLPSVI